MSDAALYIVLYIQVVPLYAQIWDLQFYLIAVLDLWIFPVVIL